MSKWIRSAFDDPPAAECRGLRGKPPRSTRSSSKKVGDPTSISASTSPFKFKRPLTPVELEASCQPWIDLYHPETASELAVSSAKISEVREWLTAIFSGSSEGKKNVSRACLIFGPTGSGKTATVRVLCKEQRASLVEWGNAEEIVAFDAGPSSYGTFRVDTGQKDEFFSFIRNSTLSRSISFSDDEDDDGPSGHRRRVVLVEEFPNAVLQRNEDFHEFLATYAANFLYPVIFVVGHDPGSGTTGRRLQTLFPDNLLNRANIRKIVFNPAAPTFLASGMGKMLDKIEKFENRRATRTFVRPSAETIGAIAELSNGDVRLCINGLQFACASSLSGNSGARLFSVDVDGKNQSILNPTMASSRGKRGGVKAMKEKLLAVKRLKWNAEENGESVAIFPVGDRDGKLDLFSVLGKILYAKRDPDESAVMRHTERVSLVANGKLRSREPVQPLLENPENLTENSSLTPDGLALFLHQNYVDFFSDIKSCAMAASYFSSIDSLREQDWRTKDIVTDSCCSYLVRGLMFERYDEVKMSGSAGRNTSSVAAGRFHPLTKPRFRAAALDEERNRTAVRAAFVNKSGNVKFSTSDTLYTDDLPLLKYCCLPAGRKSTGVLRPDQIAVVNCVTSFAGVNTYRRDVTSNAAGAAVEVEEDYFEASNEGTVPDTPCDDADADVGTDDRADVSARCSDASNLADLIQDFDD